MVEMDLLLISFSIGSALLFLLFTLIYHIFKQKHLMLFSWLYFLLFISNIVIIIYMNQEVPIFLILYFSLTIGASYFLYSGTKVYYKLKQKPYEAIGLIILFTFSIAFSFFPTTELIGLSLLMICSLWFYVISSVIYYRYGINKEKCMSGLLLILILMTFIKPYFIESIIISQWISLIQGYLGLLLALGLIGIHLNKTHNEILEQKQQLTYLSNHDSLTDVYNRTYMKEFLADTSSIKKLPLVIAMMDMDNLKVINDSYGHDAGDQAIVSFAREIKSVAKSSDIIIRRSGDEFLLIMCDTNEKDAQNIVDIIKERVEKVLIADIYLSVSIGYAVMTDSNQSFQDIIRLADQAMYLDKEKNKIKTSTKSI